MPCGVCVQVSDSLLALLLADEREALKITSTGLKLFERQEMKGKQTSKCMYRIAQVGIMLVLNGAGRRLKELLHAFWCAGDAPPDVCLVAALLVVCVLDGAVLDLMLRKLCCLQEGLPFLLPHLTKQRVRLGVDDFLRLLVEKNLPLLAAGGAAAAAADGADAPEGVQQQQQKPASGQAPLDTPEVLQQLESVQLGGAVAVLEEAVAARLGMATEEASGALTVNAPLAIAVWRTPASLSVLVSKTECEQLADKVKKALQRSQQQHKQLEQQQPAAEAVLVG
jgi:hypothetical protein